MVINSNRIQLSGNELVPPSNHEAERCVLGCCLLEKAAFLTVMGELKEDDFHNPRHRRIFRAIHELFIGDVSPDYITLTNVLLTRGTLEEAGGAEYIASLTNVVPSVRNAEHYSKIVKDLSLLRKFRSLGQQMVSMVDESKKDLRTILDETSNNFLELSQSRDSRTYSPISNVASEFWRDYCATYNDKDPQGVPSGFPDLDKFTMGFQKGNLIILAARPSEGKTALALDFAKNAVIDAGAAVAFMSLEMTRRELAIRLVCSTGGVDSNRLKAKQLSDHPDSIGMTDYQRAENALRKLEHAKLFVDDSSSLTITELRAKVKAIKLEHGLDMVIVDYLQLVDGEVGGADMRVQEVSRVSRSLKSLARELEVPVIALSQLSRNLEHRDGKKKVPRLSDLRESGSIEQDADVVLFIHRHIEEDDDDQMAQYEGPNVQETKLIVAKNRNGRRGSINLEFFKHCFTFRSSTEPPISWREDSLE